MGSFFLLLLIIGLIYLLWPVIRLFRQIRNVQRNQQEFWRGFTKGASASDPSRPQRPVRRKKIDRNVGEYVEFEEISGTYTPPAPAPFTPEQQVSDADFEDIK